MIVRFKTVVLWHWLLFRFRVNINRQASSPAGVTQSSRAVVIWVTSTFIHAWGGACLQWEKLKTIKNVFVDLRPEIWGAIPTGVYCILLLYHAYFMVDSVFLLTSNLTTLFCMENWKLI